VLDVPPSSSGRSSLEVAIRAAHTGARILLQRFVGEKQVTHKGRADVVTDVDHESEKVILEVLQHEYPTFGVLAEEGGSRDEHAEYIWVVDPLDGTRNYVSGIPHFAVNIALVKGTDVLVAVTYDPVRDELFHAAKGKGAFLGETPIKVSQRTKIADAVLGIDMGYVDKRAKHALQLLESLWPGMQAVRIMGSAALGLAYAASGRIDMYSHHHLAPWDVVSGLLLIDEAGGIITDRRGTTATLYSESVIASSISLHTDFMRLSHGTPWREE
jgi:myo-inositol-1(or 4)-monophosphatase